MMSVSTSVVKTKSFHGKIPWPKAPAVPQNFSFPSTIIYYIAKNPTSSRGYSKMIRSCKWFFEENPILVTPGFHHGRVVCCSVNTLRCAETGHKCSNDIEKLLCKIWLTRSFSFAIPCLYGPLPLLICSKIYQSDIVELYLRDRYISYDDFKFLTSKIRHGHFINLKIIYQDGSAVMFEKILEAIPSIVEFEYSCNGDYSMLTAAALNNISELRLKHLKSFDLDDLPGYFDVDDILSFFKVYKNTKISLFFGNKISDHYKIQLEKLTDIIIETKISKCLIDYWEQDDEKLKIMEERFENE